MAIAPATNLAAALHLPAAAPVAKSTPAPVPVVAPAVVPEWLKPVLTPAPGSSFADRVKILRARAMNLKDDEVKALYSYLLTPAHADDQSRSGENWLRNVMLDRLIAQPNLPANLPTVLVSIYQDPQQDVVMRDYAIQHINPAYDRAGAEDKAAMTQAMWQATGETDSSIAGTALLALNDLAPSNPELDRNRIAQTALKLAGDDSCGELTRITAIQLCGQLRVQQAEAGILQLAQNARSIPLQIAAIAALGDVGGPDQIPFLNGVLQGTAERLKLPAQRALNRIQQRLQR